MINSSSKTNAIWYTFRTEVHCTLQNKEYIYIGSEPNYLSWIAHKISFQVMRLFFSFENEGRKIVEDFTFIISQTLNYLVASETAS